MNYYHRGAFGGNIAIDYLKKAAPVTLTLIAINSAIHILAMLMGSQMNLIIWGAMAPIEYVLATGEYWRFITSMFIHSGLGHIIFNMIILLHAGGFLEANLGSKTFTYFYISAGLLVSVFSGIFTNTLSVGASGAIFALLGFILYFDLQARRRGFKTGNAILPLVVANIIFTILVPNISFVGHVSGLIIGYLYASYKDRYNPRTA